MYIRKSQQKHAKTGAVYSTYRLVESYRNAEGHVRQQTLLNLGSHFAFPQTQWKELADRVEEIQRGQGRLFALDHALEKEAERIAKLLTKQWSNKDTRAKESNKEAPDYQSVDVNSLTHTDLRKIGAEHVAYAMAKQIKLDAILSSLRFTKRQKETAIASIISRLVYPGSELSTHRYLTQNSALDELMDTDFTDIGLENLYNISDQLLDNKESIEQCLYQTEKETFKFEEIITLYDLTNTYFEGRCVQNPKAQYGRSKEKRSDCGLVTLAMVLDSSGFPKKSKIYPGNVSEQATLKDMLEALQGDKQSIIVMDAGIATEKNIEWLQQEGYRYIVVSRKRHLQMPDIETPVILKEEKNNRVEAVLVNNKTTNELELYCHSQEKEAKTTEMLSKASKRYEDELEKLAVGLDKKGFTKKYDKVMERLGRLKEKNRKINALYEITVEADAERANAIKLTWVRNEANVSTKKAGIYCLRTNQKNLDAHKFWEIYTTLTDLESAFRSLKTELGFRPVYHQKESRIDGHLFISVLAYHLLHSIRYQLKAKGIHSSWQTLRDILSTQSRITSS
ncbi:MAG: IS1634 family transposase, partial [Legionellales bacterium]|nr:IS1634 family transposase [Legionellales bacterium]